MRLPVDGHGGPARSAPELSRPLDGIRVIDFSTMMAGPYCTRLLADLGADVIKVESLEGDHIRKRPPLRDGHSTYFGHLNCGKRSIAIDLKHERGAAVARRLIAASDIVVENFRPGVMKRLGLDYATLHEELPRVIYCSISGFGQTGPASGNPAYAPIIHAASGYDLAHLQYQDGQLRPAKTGIFIADVLGGINAFGAIQTALFQRERTGRGQFIDVALMDAMLNMLVFECQEAQFHSKGRRPLYVPLRAADGYVIVAPISQNNFERLADEVGHSEWKTDPRFSTSVNREHNWDLLMQFVEAWTSTRPAADCEAILMSKGVPCSRYLTVGEAMTVPQTVARGSFSQVNDAAGPFLVPNAPFQFSDASTKARPFVAGLGEHGQEILMTVLNCTAVEIETFKGEGAVMLNFNAPDMGTN